MYYLTVSGVVKDERFYLEEFLEFHILQGVEHFFLVDNGSRDGTQDILEHYSNLGLVTWTVNLMNPVQFIAYNEILLKYGYLAKWMAFIDCDEFAYGVHRPLSECLRDYEEYAGVAIRWIFFGSNGHETKTDGLVIERFTKREAKPDKHIKSIVQPHYTVSVGGNPHIFKTSNYVVDENFVKLPENYTFTEGASANVMRINHYHTKSKAEYFERKSKKPDPGLGRIRPLEWIPVSFAAHDLNEVEDLSAFQHAEDLKDALESRK